MTYDQTMYEQTMMKFDEWFALQGGWVKQKSRRADFGAEWEILRIRGVPEETIAGVFEKLIAAMRDEGGK